MHMVGKNAFRKRCRVHRIMLIFHWEKMHQHSIAVSSTEVKHGSHFFHTDKNSRTFPWPFQYFFHFSSYFTARKRSLRRLCFYTSVSHSVHGGEGCACGRGVCIAGGHTCPGAGVCARESMHGWWHAWPWGCA